MSISKTDLTVADVMLPRDRVPVVQPETFFKQSLEEMGKHRLGIACVVDKDDKLVGIVTDGDIRRRLLTEQKPFPALFADDTVTHATRGPSTASPDMTLIEALKIMEDLEIWDLPVVAADGTFVGLLHLHPAIKAVMEL